MLSRSMQADLRNLNLKRTFSFLQNLDYNEDEATLLVINNQRESIKQQNTFIEREIYGD